MVQPMMRSASSAPECSTRSVTDTPLSDVLQDVCQHDAFFANFLNRPSRKAAHCALMRRLQQRVAINQSLIRRSLHAEPYALEQGACSRVHDARGLCAIDQRLADQRRILNWPSSWRPPRPKGKTVSTTLVGVARYSAHVMIIASLVALSMAGTVPDAAAQTADVLLPDHATARRYGGGWTCDRGYRQTGESCAAVVVPPNAYLSPFGNDWECQRLFRKRDGACVAVVVPEHAYVDDDTYGRGWRCDQGFREASGACLAVQVPANAFAADSSFGSGWRCERGFRTVGERCESVAVPGNALLDISGERWNCNRGFIRTGQECAAIEVPENAYMNSAGTDWRCERGFKRNGAACTALQVPSNAHVDFSGNNWGCNEHYFRTGESCTAERAR